MTWIHPVLALILSLLFGFLLVTLLGWRHPRRPAGTPSLVFLLLLMFPLIWAVALWMAPVGPVILGAAVVPALLFGLLITLVLAVLREPPPAPTREDAEADAAATVFGVAFWILMLATAAAIVAGYLNLD